MTLKVTVDPDLCYGSGACVSRQPGVFAWDAEGVATVVGDGAALGQEELVTVARSCPVAAISVYDDDLVVHQGGV